MKKLINLLVFFPLIVLSQGLMITEIADPNGGHNYRYIELFNNSNSDVTLSNYDIKIATNGSGSYNQTVSLSGTLKPNHFYIAAYSASTFLSGYNIVRDGSGTSSQTGDDVIALVLKSNSSVQDIYGVLGEDGTNKNWDYEDGRAERKTGSNPTSTFDVNDWNIDNDNGDGAGARSYNQDFDPGYWIGATDVKTFVGASGNTAWATASNWSSGSAPDNNDIIHIHEGNAIPQISTASIEIASLNIKNNGSLTITKDGQLTVSGEITNASGSLTIQSDSDESGSLIAKSASTPIITFNNYIYSAQWKLIGLPVTGEVVNDIDDNLLASGSKSAIGYWDNDKAGGAGWVTFNTGSTSGTELENTRGYEIRAASSDGTVSFTGTMLNSDLTNVAITTESSPGSNWNLVGNPYPSYVRMTDDSGDTNNNFLKVNASAIDDTAEAVYGWDGTSYDIYDHDDDASGRPDLIAPGTGFFIYAASDTNVSFTEAMQVHNGSIGFHGSLANGSESQRSAKVTIRMNDEFLSKNLRILFNDKSSIGLDRGGDIRAFPFGESHIYMQLLEGYQNVDFAKQSLPYNNISLTTIPLGIKTPGSKMVLNFVENTLPEYIDMYLEDTKENTFKKITDGFEINFDEAYEGLGRFYLHFTDQLIPELPTDDNLRIYKGSDSDVMVMGAVGKNYSAKVYDYSGRLIKEVNFNHKTKINDLDSKMKILRIESEEGLTIKKFKLN